MAALRTHEEAREARRARRPPWRWVVALELLVGLSAAAGGALLIADPSGGLLRVPLALLQGTPLQDFLVPGLVLFIVVGLGNLEAASLASRHHPRAGEAAVLAGAATIFWLEVQAALVGLHWLQAPYGAAGVAILALGLVARRRARRREALAALRNAAIRAMPAPRVLVAFGTRRGGTAGLAEELGDELAAEGFAVHVLPARDVDDVSPYDAVVVGGAIYVGRWHKDTRRFLGRHASRLAGKRLWLFSSGPLDTSAAQHEIPPVRHVRRWMDRLDVTEHVTFGGRLDPDASGFLAGAMARKHAGDFRDPAQIRAWGRLLAAALRPAPTAATAPGALAAPPVREPAREPPAPPGPGSPG